MEHEGSLHYLQETQLIPLMSHLNPIQNPVLVYLRSILIIFPVIHKFQQCFLSPGFPIKIFTHLCPICVLCVRLSVSKLLLYSTNIHEICYNLILNGQNTYILMMQNLLRRLFLRSLIFNLIFPNFQLCYLVFFSTFLLSNHSNIFIRHPIF
jgi:hypothetical protein